MAHKEIGRYQIQGEIGRGGMATVLKGYDPRFQRVVAVKLLPREFLHDPQFRIRFQREAQTIAALEHPAIVPVYDFGDADGQLFLVMRFMSGGSLADRLENGPLSITGTARIFERLAPALDSAHSMGIIHRDLKPANILFDKWNNPYLADFGIAKLIAGSAAALTVTGGLVGTPAYMSPEQAQAVKKLDGRSDIYAMGVILFQMLTGKMPYNADTPIGLALKHITDPVPNVLEIDPSFSPAYQGLIEKAMAKKREDRPQTAEILATGISNLARRRDAAVALPTPPARETILDSQIAPSDPEPEPIPTEMPVSTPEPEKPSPEIDVLPFPTEAPAPTPSSIKRVQETVVLPLELKAEQIATAPQPIAEFKVDASPVQRRISIWGWIGGIVVVALALFGIFKLADGGGNATVAPTNTVPAVSQITPETPIPEPTDTRQVSTPTDTATPEPTNMPTITPTPTPGIGSTHTRPTDGAVMVYVPAGNFMMGSNDGDSDEQPIHEVYLDAYWIDQTEVTNGMYAQCAADGACRPPEINESATRSSYYGNAEFDDYPVIHVSWEDAKTYCEWVGSRLPTEAEWEKAARWDEKTQESRIYPWGETIDCNYANYNGGCVGDTTAVGSYLDGASPYGALDMAGNVWEWTADWYDSDYYQNSPTQNPQGPDNGSSRVLRGGSWLFIDIYVRAASRVNLDPAYRNYDVGFRCAQE